MNKMIPSELVKMIRKVNGEIEPVFTNKFELQDSEGTYSCTFIDYGEFKGTGIHLLYFDFNDAFSQTIGFGTYNVNNNGVTSFDIYGVSTLDQEFQIVSLPNTNIGTTPTYSHIIANTQPNP